MRWAEDFWRDEDTEENLWSFSFWEYSGQSFGFWTRLRMAWRTFRTGYSSTDIVLTTSAVKELVAALEDSLGPTNAPEGESLCKLEIE